MDTKHNLPNLVAEIYNILEPLEPFDRKKVVGSALTLLGDDAEAIKTDLNGEKNKSGMDLDENYGAKMARWMQQNSIESSAIEKLFFKENENVEVIASDVLGQTKKEKAKNCYLLAGIRGYLAIDEPKFSDLEAVELCKHMGCHDQANHAKTRSELGNIVAGSKNNGYTLPAPGLRAAAELIKSMAEVN